MRDILKSGFEKMGLSVSEGQIESLIKHKEILVKTNENVNLTAITDDEGVAVKHFLDSASLLTVCDIKEGASIIDVGTGAGFPGLVLKILRPDISLTLLDSLRKRIDFLKDVAISLNLDGIDFVHSRAEEGARKKEMREAFDFAVSRAVAKMSTLSEYCLPYVKVSGTFAALKGPLAKEEIEDAKNAIKLLGGSEAVLKEVNIPHSDLKHTIVLVDKESPTSTKYPRNAPKPSQNPL